MNFLRGFWARKADFVSSVFYALLGVLMAWLTYEFAAAGGTSLEPMVMTVILAMVAVTFFGLAVYWAITERRPTETATTKLCLVWRD